MKTNVCFKRISYGNNKGEIIAILSGGSDNIYSKEKVLCSYTNPKESLQATYMLFDADITPRSKSFFKEARTATMKEYSATKTKLERDFGLDLEVVNRIKY